MPRGKSTKKSENGPKLGFEATLWAASDKMRGHMDAAVYKHVVLGLVFLKYISDAFQEKRSNLELALPTRKASDRDLHKSLKADFVIANPPFNMSDWGGERLREDKRWAYGAPPVGIANYAWIQHFVHHRAPHGTAGFVLANGNMSSNSSPAPRAGSLRTSTWCPAVPSSSPPLLPWLRHFQNSPKTSPANSSVSKVCPASLRLP